MSKLKSTWDAVNELRGDLNNTPKFNGDERYLFHFVNQDRIGSSYNKHGLDGVINHICTIEEFNALVEEMTLGLDVNPVNHGHYLNYVYADKTPLKKEALDSIVNKPLVYTQEMADNGELPSVGMKVMLEEDTDFFSCASGEIKTLKANDIVYVVAIGNRSDNNAPVITLMKQGAGFCTINPDYIKPIDQRTKKEKAIDEFMAENLKGGISFKYLISKAYDDWVGE